MCVTLKSPLPRPGRAARHVPVLVRDTRTIRLVVFHVGIPQVPGAASARWRRADQEGRGARSRKPSRWTSRCAERTASFLTGAGLSPGIAA